MTERLNPASAKVRRAAEHLAIFRQAWHHFLNDGSYDVRASLVDGTRDVYLWLNVHKQPSVSEWAPIIGDAINNLRSSLDNLVWDLSARYSEDRPPPDPIPYASKWRRVSFPIVLQQKDWERAAEKRLWAMPELWPKFEDLQPFATNPLDPDAADLAVLDELWNIDKHRHLHTGIFMVQQLAGIFTVQGADGGSIPYDVVRTYPPGPFSDGADLGVLRLKADPAGYPKVSANTTMMFDVALDDDAAPAYRRKPLFSLLSGLERRIVAIHAAFAHEGLA